MSDPLPAPNFNLQYTVPPMNIGEGYAQGISQAGQSIAGALTGILGGVNPKTGEIQQGILGQQRAADDTLAAMKQSGMLSQEQYDAVAGKSLAAKQQMTGLFANQWIQEQAMRRSLGLEQGKGQVEVDVAQQKMNQVIEAVQKGYGIAAGVQPGKLTISPSGAQPVQQSQLGQTPALGSGSPVAAGTGTTTVPALASQVKPTSKLIIGQSIGSKETVPPGGRIGTVRGQQGILMPDGTTFRPFTQ